MTDELVRLIMAVLLTAYLWLRPRYTGTPWDQDVKITLSVVVGLAIVVSAINFARA